MRGVLFLIAVVVFSCKAVDPKSPEGTFARLAKCIDKADAKCLYNRLDRDSRWSVQTVHRMLSEMRAVVEQSYPNDARKDAYGVWEAEAHAKDAAQLFGTYCEKRKCLQRIAREFGAVSKLSETAKDTVVLETTRGGTFEMFFAEERWGITMLRDELQDVKIRIQDRARQIEKNAAQFEQQRLAGTIGDENSKGEEEQ